MTNWPKFLLLAPFLLSGCATVEPPRDCSIIPENLSANFGSEASYRSYHRLQNIRAKRLNDEIISRSNKALNSSTATEAAKLYFLQARAGAYIGTKQYDLAVQDYAALSRLPSLPLARKAHFERLQTEWGNPIKPNAIELPINTKDALPLIRVPPRFPTRFLNGDKSGHCQMKFDVDATGKVVNADAEYCTDDALRQSSIDSLVLWKYAPKTVGGEAILRENNRTKITYSLRDECGYHLPE